mgnify:CR=1 FL=1|tara:strand:- start:114824 stop:116131 length:1308 start_codon:yes stop_codon:yes gene_type:complete
MNIDTQDIINKMQVEYLANYPIEAANDLETLSTSEIISLLQTSPFMEIQPTIKKLSEDTLIAVISELNDEYCKKMISCLSVEKINKVISGLEESKKRAFLLLVPKGIKREIKEIRKYPVGTAGSIMDTNIIHFYPSMTVRETINKIKSRNKKGIRSIFIADEEGKLHSMSSMQALIMAEENEYLKDIAKPIPTFVSNMDNQEEIVSKFEEYKLTDIPVVDIHNHFVGVVKYHALMKAAKDELTKDMQKMVGVSEDERALSKVFFSVKKRLPWLEINLLTAFLAASVVGLFQNTIAQFTALAVLLPVVAGQSGNTGAQALAVTMRGLALKEIRTSHWLILMIKELRIALITGFVVALTTACGVYFWSGSIGLTLIIGISMIASMVMAGISGAAVPLILSRLGQDPASSSSILLTTVTDVCGFFSFLGIATLLSKFI